MSAASPTTFDERSILFHPFQPALPRSLVLPGAIGAMDFQYLMVGETSGVAFHRGLRVDLPQLLNIGLTETSSATVQLPAIGEFEETPDVVLPLHILVRHLKDAAAPITVMPHTKMPTANDTRELDVLQQHVVAISSVASSEFLPPLEKAGFLAIHLAIEKTGPQGLDKINHNRIELVTRSLQGADATRMLEVGRVRWLLLTARDKTERGGREGLGDRVLHIAAIIADEAQIAAHWCSPRRNWPEVREALLVKADEVALDRENAI